MKPSHEIGLEKIDCCVLPAIGVPGFLAELLKCRVRFPADRE